MAGTFADPPVIRIPNQRQKPYMGTIVHGLLMRAAVNTTSLLRRNIQASRRHIMVCSPMVGEKAMKTPRAKAAASWLGESSSFRIFLMRSFTYFILIEVFPDPS